LEVVHIILDFSPTFQSVKAMRMLALKSKAQKMRMVGPKEIQLPSQIAAVLKPPSCGILCMTVTQKKIEHARDRITFSPNTVT
jgi:hypothetical protein